MKQDKSKPKKEQELAIRAATSEIFSFWNKLPENYKHQCNLYKLGELLIIVLKELVLVEPDRVKNLYKVSKFYPDSHIRNYSGAPILTIRRVD